MARRSQDPSGPSDLQAVGFTACWQVPSGDTIVFRRIVMERPGYALVEREDS